MLEFGTTQHTSPVLAEHAVQYGAWSLQVIRADR